MYGHTPANHTTPRRGQDPALRKCGKIAFTPALRTNPWLRPRTGSRQRYHPCIPPYRGTCTATPRPAIPPHGGVKTPPYGMRENCVHPRPTDKSTATPSHRATATTRQVFAGCMSFAVLFFIKEIPERIPNKNPRCGDFHSGDFVENSFGTFLIRKVQRTSCAQDYLYRSTRRDRCS